MNTLKLLVGGAAVAVLLVAFGDFDNGGWHPAAGRLGGPGLLDDGDDEEPILGYDGMDRDTLIQWMREAELDADMLIRVHEYESRHRARGAVLDAVSALLA